ncbi:MAG: UPF0182 family protein, partial [bacterium]|nr:UPF0182 family protein [bacterium]
MKLTKFFSWVFLAIVVIAFIFFSSIVSLVTDWWWYQEVGFTEIFIKSLIAKIIVGAGVGLFAAVFLLTNLLIAVRSKIPWMASIPGTFIGFGQPLNLNNRLLGKFGIIFSCIISIFIALLAASSWHDVLKFLSSVPFGQKDPIFSQDVSFYVFSLPVFSLGLGLIKTVILISLIGCGFIYVLRGSLNLSSLFPKIDLSKLTGKPETLLRPRSEANLFIRPAKDQTEPEARLHIGILLSLFLTTIAAGTYLSPYNLLISQSGPVFGAAFTDANVMVPILRVSVFVYGLTAILALFYGVSGKIAPLFGAISLTVIVGFASVIIPTIFQKLVVAPNELTKETPFIKYNIEASRKAYGLDKVEEREIAADKPITAPDIAANNLTIKNVRLWDRAPLLSTFSQIQEIRTYYEFASVDNDRYTINNEVRQIMLSPRELASDSLPNKNWINERLTFTHGYGVAAGPVNQVTPEGLPV